MRLVFLLLAVVLVLGCVENPLTGNSQSTTISPEKDARIRGMMSDLVQSSQEYADLASQTTTTSETTTTEAPSTTLPASTTFTTTTVTTTTVAKTIECSKVSMPMGQADCDKGYCTDFAGGICKYHPGGMYRTAWCGCVLPKQ